MYCCTWKRIILGSIEYEMLSFGQAWVSLSLSVPVLHVSYLMKIFPSLFVWGVGGLRFDYSAVPLFPYLALPYPSFFFIVVVTHRYHVTSLAVYCDLTL